MGLVTRSPQEITQLLREWSAGDRSALDKLLPLVSAELRRMAKRYMGQQQRGHTLQTTALIHEAYTAGWAGEETLAEPRPFLRRRCAGDAAHPG